MSIVLFTGTIVGSGVLPETSQTGALVGSVVSQVPVQNLAEGVTFASPFILARAVATWSAPV